MKKVILEINNLTKYYGKIRGIENFSLKLHEGDILGFIGPNGAGKSTTIRCIMNLINKNSGTIIINNKELSKNDIEMKKIIGYLPSEVNLYTDLTVRQMINYHCSFYKEDLSKRRKELVKLLALDERKKVEDLSLGNLKKLAIVLALVHNPKILILDEPTSGLDPLMQNVFYEILKEEKAKGTTIIYSTHVLEEVSKICDEVVIIKDGKKVQMQSIEQINNKNTTIVKIKSQENNKILNELGVKDLSEDKEYIKFIANISADQLLKKLSKYKIDKILIENMKLEEMFFHYYK